MEYLDRIILIMHIFLGAMLFMLAGIMQLIVGPIIGKIENSDDRNKASGVIKRRVEPLIRTIIIMMTLSALYLLYSRWANIGTSSLIWVKIIFGGTALIFANLLHFYFRPIKMNLKISEQNEDVAKLNKLNKVTFYMEKVVLAGSVFAFFMGVLYNHF